DYVKNSSESATRCLTAAARRLRGALARDLSGERDGRDRWRLAGFGTRAWRPGGQRLPRGARRGFGLIRVKNGARTRARDHDGQVGLYRVDEHIARRPIGDETATTE